MDVQEQFIESLSRVMPDAQYIRENAHPEYGQAITIPARHPEVGDLVIEVEDDDIRVHIGNITHCHFNWYPNDGVDTELGQSTMIQEAVEFLNSAIHDRVVFWRGWWMDGSFPYDEFVTMRRKRRVRYYLWSGPA